MKRKWFLVILFLLFACVFLFAGWKLTEELLEYRAGEQSYAALESYVSIPAPPPSAAPLPAQTPAAAAEPEEAEEAEADPTVWPVVDFEALQEVNPDIVAWLYLEGTVLNYPVVQGEDNDHYLYYMFDGSWNGIGCIFLDSRNSGDFTDRNSVIYGHHMQNGSMFACLDGYKKQEFYDAHPTILLLTPEKNYRLELFSAYVASVDDDAWTLDFTRSEYEAWLNDAVNRSCFKSPVVPTVQDRVVTLSTCSYEFSNAKLVVLGILK